MSKEEIMIHVVPKPVLTDEMEMLGMYVNLFLVVGIEVSNELLFALPPTSSFNHPIPEENAKLVASFAETAASLRDKVMDFNLKLKNVLVNGHNVTFLFVVKSK